MVRFCLAGPPPERKLCDPEGAEVEAGKNSLELQLSSPLLEKELSWILLMLLEIVALENRRRGKVGVISGVGKPEEDDLYEMLLRRAGAPCDASDPSEEEGVWWC